ncbi:CBS domain-containing protein [Candidatus Bathyarchaeota archaeon]|jgi:CBS domain-containing protein|nr:MAG: CBS domain-containing protein [Candidatus Bathyarchaeota archaeon]
MTRGYLSVSPHDSLETVAKRMFETGHEYAVVLDDGELKGLVSVDEIIREVMSSVVSRISVEGIPMEFRQMLLSELMNNPRAVNFMESCGFKGTNLAISIGESNTIEEAIQLLASNSLEQVLVLNEDGLVGILRNTDLLKAITELAN